MDRLCDEDGVDGPFDRRIAAAMRDDSRAWARRLGLAALEHIGKAAAGQDRRIAHEYHEQRAVNFARRAAHHARLSDPSLGEATR